jgi:3'5'-cyclic nucleotide phosphodiesterase
MLFLLPLSRRYVTAIASMYRNNHFHNFEHASHVTLSVSKLMARIVAPDIDDIENVTEDTLHDHTYGITSDPLIQFACVLSALIHDVDHTGVPNGQLIKENAKLAVFYKGRSVAEQNSVDLSWDLLMSDCFSHLRQAIYRTDEERQRFRELVVNSVMATDIMDKDLKELRNARWDKAFKEGSEHNEESTKDAIDRKATIVIEHLIQASDVSHTMQHWHVYRKWNARLFAEMSQAFMEGRAEKNPAEFWYQGEIGFFDYYVIPLAKKLKDCGVFGVSSDEYLNYAIKNREEWNIRGQELVAEMIQQMEVASEAAR